MNDKKSKFTQTFYFSSVIIQFLISINHNFLAKDDTLTTFIAAQYSSKCNNTPKCVEIVSVCDKYLKLLNEKKVDTSCEVNLKEVCKREKNKQSCN